MTMRIDAPQEPFEITFASPDGEYVLAYRPIDKWDGELSGLIREVKVTIGVVSVEREIDGGRALMGGTSGFQRLHGDEFWAELRPDRTPATIDYFGDGFLWRTDAATPNVS
jgi:hypothetical protein